MSDDSRNGEPRRGRVDSISLAWQASIVPMTIFGLYNTFTSERPALITFFGEVGRFGLCLVGVLLPALLIVGIIKEYPRFGAYSAPLFFVVWVALGVWARFLDMPITIQVEPTIYEAVLGVPMIGVPAYLFLRNRARQAS